MGGRVVLHIGTMKSGTSFIQSVLGHHQPQLAESGFDFLGGAFGVQARAVRDLLKLPKRPGKNRRRWAAVTGSALAETHTGIVSMEFLSFADQAQIREALRPLEDREVQVVLTVRDQFRAIPAQWQTFTRNFGTDDWDTYLRRIQAPWASPARKSRAYRTFHRAQDVTGIVERWTALPQVRGVDIVTVPPPGAPRGELWSRFCAATGIPADVVTGFEDARDNESLGYASCDYLRRANRLLRDVPPRRYRKGMRPLAAEVLVPLRESEGRPALDQRGAGLARHLNEQIHTLIADGRHRHFGDPSDLPVPAGLEDHAREVAPPEPDRVLRAARAVWEHAASATGAGGSRAPRGLDETVRDGVALLRRANGWDRYAR